MNDYPTLHHWVERSIGQMIMGGVLEKFPGLKLVSVENVPRRPGSVQARHFARVNYLIWTSDFPHSDSTWPHSREVIARDFESVPEGEIQRMVADNAAELVASANRQLGRGATSAGNGGPHRWFIANVRGFASMTVLPVLRLIGVRRPTFRDRPSFHSRRHILLGVVSIRPMAPGNRG